MARTSRPARCRGLKHLAELVAGKTLIAQCYEKDQYGREVCALILEDGRSANRLQVEAGYAWPIPRARATTCATRPCPICSARPRPPAGVCGRGRARCSPGSGATTAGASASAVEPGRALGACRGSGRALALLSSVATIVLGRSYARHEAAAGSGDRVAAAGGGGLLQRRQPVNSPYESGAESRNTLYSAFVKRSPKYLDPASSYSNDETPYTYNVYETLYGYHYLKRPYELVRGCEHRSARLPGQAGQHAACRRAGRADRAERVRHQAAPRHALRAASGLRQEIRRVLCVFPRVGRRLAGQVRHPGFSADRHARSHRRRLRLCHPPPGQPARGVADLFTDGRVRARPEGLRRPAASARPGAAAHAPGGAGPRPGWTCARPMASTACRRWIR